MPLIKCIDCGRDFSSYAHACPFCGWPTSVVMRLGGAAQYVNPPQAAEGTAGPQAQPAAPQYEEAPQAQPQFAPTQQAPSTAPQYEEAPQAPSTAPQYEEAQQVQPQPAADPVVPVVPIVIPVMGSGQANAAAPAQSTVPPEAASLVAPITGDATAEQPSAGSTATKDPNYVAVTCPSCGSHEINFISTGYGVCRYCGTQVVLDGSDKQPTATINVYASAAHHDATYLGIKKSLDPVTFYRTALLHLVEDESTPPDIFDGQFETAVECNKHMGVFTGNVTGSYSANIGYDMVRKYTTVENGRTVEHKENYIRWEPFSGNYAGTHQAVAALDEDKEELDEDILDAYNRALNYHELDKDTTGTDDIVTPTQDVINDAMDECKRQGESKCRLSLPGDHHKDFNFAGYAQLSNYVCHTIPTSSIPFTYKEKLYRKSAFAVESAKDDTFGTIPSASDKICAEVDTKSRPLGIASLALMAASLVFSLLFALIRLKVPRAVGLSISLPLFLAGVAVTVTYWVKRYLHRRAIVRANREAKLAGVTRILEDKGLDPITDIERARILGDKKALRESQAAAEGGDEA